MKTAEAEVWLLQGMITGLSMSQTGEQQLMSFTLARPKVLEQGTHSRLVRVFSKFHAESCVSTDPRAFMHMQSYNMSACKHGSARQSFPKLKLLVYCWQALCLPVLVYLPVVHFLCSMH